MSKNLLWCWFLENQLWVWHFFWHTKELQNTWKISGNPQFFKQNFSFKYGGNRLWPFFDMFGFQNSWKMAALKKEFFHFCFFRRLDTWRGYGRIFVFNHYSALLSASETFKKMIYVQIMFRANIYRHVNKVENYLKTLVAVLFCWHKRASKSVKNGSLFWFFEQNSNRMENRLWLFPLTWNSYKIHLKWQPFGDK